jgi:hypothetical protein
MDTAAVRCPQHHWAGQSPAGAVSDAARMINDLIDGRIDKTHELNLGNRPYSLGCHADRNSGDHAFGQRCVLDAVLAKSLLQPGGRPKNATVDADIFAEDYHLGIVFEFPGHGHRQRID